MHQEERPWGRSLVPPLDFFGFGGVYNSFRSRRRRTVVFQSSALSPPQPHARRVAAGELDAGGLEGGLNCSNGRRNRLSVLKFEGIDGSDRDAAPPAKNTSRHSSAELWRGRPSLAAEPVVSADPFCGDTPQRPESESADGLSVTG